MIELPVTSIDVPVRSSLKRDPRFERGRSLLLIVMILVTTFTLVAGENEWPPIPPEDLVLADNPALPGSDAMILLKRETRDDKKGTLDVHRRIKIFSRQGLRHGNIEIPFMPKRFDVDRIEARVIHPDGRVTEFKGPFYEKTLARYRKQRVLAKTFSLPNLEPGSIIDYRYQWRVRGGSDSYEWIVVDEWVVQEELFVREAQLEMQGSGDFVKVVPRSMPEPVEMPPDGKGVRRGVLREVPPFRSEPFSLPDDSLKMRYVISYPSSFYSNPYHSIRDQNERFIGGKRDLSEVVAEIVAATDPDETKLRKLYDAVQERIRNLSYEETYSKRERKREGIRERKRARDVWKYGYGTSEEIVLLFAALCRAAGIWADPVLVVSREHRIYDPAVDLLAQLEGWLVVVDGPEGPRFFDPGTRFAPFGWIYWGQEGVSGVRLGRETILDVRVPFQDVERNTTTTSCSVDIESDGSAVVEMHVRLSGTEAVELRDELFELSTAETEKALETRLRHSVPQARIGEVTWSGVADSSDEATINYRFQLPLFAQRLGERLVVPLSLGRTANPFPTWKRTYPVYLRSSQNRIQEVRINPPPGYRIEKVPEPDFLQAPFGVAGAEISVEEGAFIYRTRLMTRVALIQPEGYGEVKRFYDRFAVINSEYALLREERGQ